MVMAQPGLYRQDLVVLFLGFETQQARQLREAVAQ
jgi:hypothetical protein